MKVLYLMRNGLHMYPPCMSQIYYLHDLGIDVYVGFSECSPEAKKTLDDKKIPYIDFGITRSKNKKWGKIQSYTTYRKHAIKFIKDNYEKGDCIWPGTADSAFSLRGFIERYPYVLSVLELYDTNSFYRKQVAKLVHTAQAIIACESTRASIMKSWWKLERKPYVMPNKPYSHPKTRCLQGTTVQTQEAIEKIKDKKIILYQGIISADRDLGLLAKALKRIDEDIYLVLMGKTFYDGVEKVKQIYDKTIYLGFFSAPVHLEITSYATVGVANYDDSCLNNLFCAPNKIFEYSGFGMPILCSDSPGLQNTVGKYNAGVCVDFSSENAVVEGIKDIFNNASHYSIGAKKMFESVDNLSTMKDIVDTIGMG